MQDADLLGAWGEVLAGKYLRRKLYKVEAWSYRSRYGEIDLVVKNWKYLVFVEVKLRKTPDFASAREFVDPKKQERIKKTAACYLRKFPTRLQPRFDVVEIYAPEGMETRRPQIIHLEDAFS